MNLVAAAILTPVIPAKAGTQGPNFSVTLGPRFPGDDDGRTEGGIGVGDHKRTPAAKPDSATVKVAAQFEALFVAQMLKSARAASLGDDLTGTGGATFSDLADQLRAEALARQAPLGVARILAAGMSAPRVAAP